MIWFGKSFIKFCKSFIDLIKLVSTRTCSSARVRPAVVDLAALTLQIRVRHRSRSARGLPSGPLRPWVLSWAVWPRHQSTTARWRRLARLREKDVRHSSNQPLRKRLHSAYPGGAGSLRRAFRCPPRIRPGRTLRTLWRSASWSRRSKSRSRRSLTWGARACT